MGGDPTGQCVSLGHEHRRKSVIRSKYALDLFSPNSASMQSPAPLHNGYSFVMETMTSSHVNERPTPFFFSYCGRRRILPSLLLPEDKLISNADRLENMPRKSHVVKSIKLAVPVFYFFPFLSPNNQFFLILSSTAATIRHHDHQTHLLDSETGLPTTVPCLHVLQGHQGTRCQPV